MTKQNVAAINETEMEQVTGGSIVGTSVKNLPGGGSFPFDCEPAGHNQRDL